MSRITEAGLGLAVIVIVGGIYLATRGESLWEDHGVNQYGEPRDAVSVYNCALCAAENCPCHSTQQGVTTETLSVPVASFDSSRQAPNRGMIRQNHADVMQARAQDRQRRKCYRERCAPCGRDYPYGQFIIGQCPSTDKHLNIR